MEITNLRKIVKQFLRLPWKKRQKKCLTITHDMIRNITPGINNRISKIGNIRRTPKTHLIEDKPYTITSEMLPKIEFEITNPFGRKETIKNDN